MSNYIVVSSNNQTQLEEMVCENLTKGWKCQGGVFVIHRPIYYQDVYDGYEACFYQAMVIEKDDKEG